MDPNSSNSANNSPKPEAEVINLAPPSPPYESKPEHVDAALSEEKPAESKPAESIDSSPESEGQDSSSEPDDVTTLHHPPPTVDSEEDFEEEDPMDEDDDDDVSEEVAMDDDDDNPEFDDDGFPLLHTLSVPYCNNAALDDSQNEITPEEEEHDDEWDNEPYFIDSEAEEESDCDSLGMPIWPKKAGVAVVAVADSDDDEEEEEEEEDSDDGSD